VPLGAVADRILDGEIDTQTDEQGGKGDRNHI
jgi:hypothetical protein